MARYIALDEENELKYHDLTSMQNHKTSAVSHFVPRYPRYPRASRAWSWPGSELHSLNGLASGILNLMHVSQKFEQLVDAHRRPDGSRWTGQQLDEATGGDVTRSYATNLRKGG
jgi:hypothetical protein